MSWKVRGALVLIVGAVLGLTVTIAASVLAARDVRPTGVDDEYVTLLTQVLDRVRREYVEPIDERTLVDGAVRGILEELDEHSRYLDATEYEDIRIATTGTYTGVGLDLRLNDGRITVIEPLVGAPAERAGIRPGDVVVSIDELPVDVGDVTGTVNRMRGAAGTAVTLDVVRTGEPTPMRFALTRTEIELKTVESAYLGEGYAYIRLSAFTEATPGDLEDAARALGVEAGRELAGLVLDLRDNPGGVLEAAVQVADVFLADGLIVRGTGRIRQARFARYAHSGGALEQVPMSVLVNGGSASASEIVAGALKDHGRARLVGERTFGKGSVQSVVPLGGGTAIKLTTSNYLTPSGQSINGTGIEPEYRVAATGPWRGASGQDEQLQQALRLVGYDPITSSSVP